MSVKTKTMDSATPYRQALADDPKNIGALAQLVATLEKMGELEEVANIYRQFIVANPGFYAAHHNLGFVLNRLGKADQAIASYRQALVLVPHEAKTHTNLGVALAGLGRYEEAMDCFAKSIALQPNNPEALCNIGNLLKVTGRTSEAMEHYRQALSHSPDYAEVRLSLGHTKLEICDWESYEADCQEVLTILERTPGKVASFALLSLPSTAEQQFMAARQLNKGAASVKPTKRPDRSNKEKIRIGYLSGDFRTHPVCYLTAGLFAQHDRSRFEVRGYSYGNDDGSEIRRQVLSTFDQWTELRDLSIDQAAQRIADDDLDILVDLTGLTSGARTAIVTRRPAPIQVNYLGYPGTMGLDCMDYIIVDRIVVPMEQQSFFSERLVQMPDCYLVNDNRRPIAEFGPSREECGLPKAGFVFCSFNNSWKFTPHLFGLWLRLLHAIPGSVLWLRALKPAASDNLRRTASQMGVDPSRLIFAPKIDSMADHLARLRHADLFLDTQPFNAHTTAAEFLWAGVPVLTVCGTTFPGRVAASLLTAAGLPELIARDLDEYGEIALGLARNPGRLEELREKLAKNLPSSRLFDLALFTKNLELAFIRMVELEKTGQTPMAFSVRDLLSDSSDLEKQCKDGDPMDQNSGKIWLHIGGVEPRAGWSILNVQPGPNVDILGDCRNLPNIHDNSCQEVYISHVLEHLSFQGDLQASLREIHRILRPGGRLRLSVPDMAKICQLFGTPNITIQDRIDLMKMLFGGQSDAFDYHRVGLTHEFLEVFLREAGFVALHRIPEFGLFHDCSGKRFQGQLISLNLEAWKAA